eukprot:3336482-Pyramimonas_sp.AAC.1
MDLSDSCSTGVAAPREWEKLNDAVKQGRRSRGPLERGDLFRQLVDLLIQLLVTHGTHTDDAGVNLRRQLLEKFGVSGDAA